MCLGKQKRTEEQVPTPGKFEASPNANPAGPDTVVQGKRGESH